MVSLAFNGFGLAKTAANQLEANPASGFWEGVKYQFSHAPWIGCSYWDLIQPSFMFLVGVSMAYSFGKRKELGDTFSRMFSHAVVRALVLVFLSILLMSKSRDSTNWTFTNVLAQIGLGYVFLFLLWGRSFMVQLLAATLILGGVWGGHELYSGAGMDVASGSMEVGVSAEWAADNLQGVRAPWHKNANLGHAVDQRLLNFFPRSEPFIFEPGGYQTINFIPSLVTMLFGLMCGELLRSSWRTWRKLVVLVLVAAAGMGLGHVLNLTGICPLVKRIWTPSWALFSTGWCCLILAALYAVIDVIGWRRWSFPLIVVGMNSIVIYCMSMSLKPWTARQLKTHLGEGIFTIHGLVDASYAPTVQAVMVGMMLWIVCYYMYRNKMFVRI